MEKAAVDLAAAKPSKPANSDAAAPVGYLAAMRVAATADTINKWLVIQAVLVVEMGGGLSLAIGMVLGGDTGMRSGLTVRASVQPERSVSDRSGEPLNASPERSTQNASQTNAISVRSPLNEKPANGAHDRVLSALRAKDGVLFGSGNQGLTALRAKDRIIISSGATLRTQLARNNGSDQFKGYEKRNAE